MYVCVYFYVFCVRKTHLHENPSKNNTHHDRCDERYNFLLKITLKLTIGIICIIQNIKIVNTSTSTTSPNIDRDHNKTRILLLKSSRRKQSDTKSSLMWTSNVLSTIVGGSKSSASKTLSSVRYSSISLHGRSASGQIILPIDVEDTVTCFCRFAHTKRIDSLFISFTNLEK